MPSDKQMDWIIEQLRSFIAAAEGGYYGSPEDIFYGYALKGNRDSVVALLPVVERIFDKYLPGWNNPPIEYDFDNP